MAKSTSTKSLGFAASEPLEIRNRIGLGWLRFSCDLDHLSYWVDRIKSLFNCELSHRGKGWNGYTESFTGIYSIMIAFTPVIDDATRRSQGLPTSPNEGRMTIDLPQSAIESLSYKAFLQIWLDIFSIEGVKFTRVDLNFDDYEKIISPEALHHRCKMGGVGVPRYENMRGWDEFNLHEGRSQGYTLYFGSPRSDRQIRFYDKSQESKGEVDCYRWEVELKGDYAEKFRETMYDIVDQATHETTLNSCVDEISRYFKRTIKGSIDFHDIPLMTATKNLPSNWVRDTPVCDFWLQLMQGLEPAKLTLDRKEPTLQSTVDWVLHQVAPALALIRSCYTFWRIPFNVWLKDALDKGKDRWKDKHEKLFRESTLTSPAYSHS